MLHDCVSLCIFRKHAHTLISTLTHTHTQAHKHRDILVANSYTHTHTNSHTLSQSLFHTLTLTLTHTLQFSCSHIGTLFCPLLFYFFATSNFSIVFSSFSCFTIVVSRNMEMWLCIVDVEFFVTLNCFECEILRKKSNW